MNPSPQFLFFGGKGGVGKTTCAGARAVADAAAGARVLVVSTDPAHSLGDVLAVPLSARPSRIRLAGVDRGAVPGRTRGSAPATRRLVGADPRVGPGSLDAMELNAPRAFARWLSEHRAALGQVLEHGTWLDRSDVDALLDLPLPGIDELVGIMEIARLAETRAPAAAAGVGPPRQRRTSSARERGAPRAYDTIVVDTAPTGHTLRLLASPQTVAAVADVLDLLQQEHRLIREQLARVGRPEAADRLITLLAQQARDTGAVLRDPDRTGFYWVTLPEPLSLAESEDGIAALDRSGIRIAEIVVNRVLTDEGRCPVCDRRRAAERRAITAIRRQLGRGRRVRAIAATLQEPRGVAALGKIGKQLLSHVGERSSLHPPVGVDPRVVLRQAQDDPEQSRRVGPLRMSSSNHERTTPLESLDVFRGVKLLFVGGKGGVGKTTVAAATALRLARVDPRRRTLLLSTDPAHSVADVLAARPGAVGDTPKRFPAAPGNLTIRELDAAQALAVRHAELQTAIDDIASAFGASAINAELEASADRCVSPRDQQSLPSTSVGAASQLMNLAPPGIDELFGILSVVDAADDYDLIVVDTAPTGHALRLLELPDTAREWVQVLLRMLLKYRSLVKPGQLAAGLVDVSKSIRALKTILRDASHTRFVVVTRAAVVPWLETERLLARLRRLKLSAPAIVVNAMTLAPGRCRRCRATAASERRPLATMRRRCASRSRGCVIIQTPLSAPPPRGVNALDRWARTWIA